MKIGVTVQDTASAMLTGIMKRTGDLSPLMEGFGRYMQKSIRKNFSDGGRPKAWEPLKWVRVGSKEEAIMWSEGLHSEHPAMVHPGRSLRARKPWKREQGKNRMGGPLVLTGDLRSSIGFTPEKNDLVLWARPAENAVKAPVHQFGTTKAGRNHDVTIPARPYLVFQREDIAWFRAALSGWVRVAKRAPE